MDDDLECPHCGGVAIFVSDNPSSVPWNDGDDSEINCECCGEGLRVVCRVTNIKWHFVDDDGDEITFDEESSQ